MTRGLVIVLVACHGVSSDPTQTVDVPAGMFQMGCHAANDPSCNPDEVPFHIVDVAEFAIDRTEVTQAAYDACVQAGACTAPGSGYDPAGHATYPVSNVSWFQADAYCTFAGERLPTEAEWEKAARGADDRVFPWGNDPPTCELASFSACGELVMPVGSFPTGASPYGALDMAGNVAEWVADWYGSDYYAATPGSDPTGPADGTNKVSRGGDLSRDATDLRVARRKEPPPGDAEVERGFRCAR